MSTTAAARDALLSADLGLAEQVIGGGAELDVRRAQCDEAYALLALQASVARDLRIVLDATYSAEKVERMGDLAAHIKRVRNSVIKMRNVADQDSLVTGATPTRRP